MPVSRFVLLIGGVILAAAVTVFVAVQVSGTVAATGGGVALGLLLATILLRRAGR